MKWTKEQDIIAYYLYRIRDKKTRSEINDIGKKMGIEAGTLNMRIGNFQFLESGSGLNRPAIMSRETFEEFRHTSLEEFGKLASKILLDPSQPLKFLK